MSMKSLIPAVLGATSLALAAINPETVISISPEQGDALLSAFGPYISSIVDDEPDLTSIAAALAINSAALSSFTAVAASITNIPTDTSRLWGILFSRSRIADPRG